MIPTRDPIYKPNVALNNAAYQPRDSVSSYCPTQFSAHECAKSIIKINCTKIKRNPPIIPKYIHVVPNEPSGMKNAPIIPAITIKYLRPQKLKMKSNFNSVT